MFTEHWATAHRMKIKSMSPASSARWEQVRNKKHQGKISLVFVYVSLQTITASFSDATSDANETKSMFLFQSLFSRRTELTPEVTMYQGLNLQTWKASFWLCWLYHNEPGMSILKSVKIV